MVDKAEFPYTGETKFHRLALGLFRTFPCPRRCIYGNAVSLLADGAIRFCLALLNAYALKLTVKESLCTFHSLTHLRVEHSVAFPLARQ